MQSVSSSTVSRQSSCAATKTLKRGQRPLRSWAAIAAALLRPEALAEKP